MRAGIEHLAKNAQDQDFPNPGTNLRTAFPDRTDTIESMIAEGDRVGMIFRVSGTHQGNFLGIPPTGKKFEFQEMALFRLADGKVTESWFMADEAGLMRQLGAKMPARRDGQAMVPPLSNAGEDPDASGTAHQPQDQSAADRARRDRRPLPKTNSRAISTTRVGFSTCATMEKGVPNQNITTRRIDLTGSRISSPKAKTWMRWLAAVHSKPLACRRPASMSTSMIGVAGGRWQVDMTAWAFLLQLGFVDTLHP